LALHADGKQFGIILEKVFSRDKLSENITQGLKPDSFDKVYAARILKDYGTGKLAPYNKV
jgi:hypothetical protein